MDIQTLNHGTFGTKKLYYSYIPSKKKSDVFYIFFHGSFSTTLKKRYFELANKLTEESIGNVLLFETSRVIPAFDTKATTDDFEKYRATFDGKTFADELADMQTLFAFFMKTYVAKAKHPKVRIVGISLGGTLSSFLIPDYKDVITDIFYLGSGVTTKNRSLSLIADYPTKAQLLKHFAAYTGNITLIQGTADTTVPQEEAREIIFAAEKAQQRTLILLSGVDHRFMFVNGEYKEEDLNQKLLEIIATG